MSGQFPNGDAVGVANSVPISPANSPAGLCHVPGRVEDTSFLRVSSISLDHCETKHWVKQHDPHARLSLSSARLVRGHVPEAACAIAERVNIRNDPLHLEICAAD